MKNNNYNTERNTTGLIAWLEKTRVTLPLKGVETRFNITGTLAEVEMDQVYFQDNQKPLDVTYTFPLPDGASIYRCELHTNDRKVKAVVKPVYEARTMVEEGRKKGHRSMLVEEVRGNLFELRLGLLMPGDTVIVRIAWFQQLEVEDTLHSLRLPFTPGVRYIPGQALLRQNKGKGTADDTDQCPDASRLTPPRIDSLHSDAAYVNIHGTIKSLTLDTISLASPTHLLCVAQSGEDISLSLAGKGEVPDRDLIIRYQPPVPDGPQATAWRGVDADGAYALVQVTAPETPMHLPFSPSDVYFLLDRSGSMDGANWHACSKAFRGFLEALDARDRVWVTMFESNFRDLAEKPLPPAAILAEPVVQKMEDLPVEGGTHLLPALEHELIKIREFSLSRRRVIVLITDGQVGTEEEILKIMKKHPDVIIHTFGIDSAVNDSFLKQLASQQRGICTLRTPQEDVGSAITALAKQLGGAVLSDLKVLYGWEHPAPERVSLAGGETISFLVRHPQKAFEDLTITARTVDGETHVIQTKWHTPSEGRAIPLLWHKKHIDHLLSDYHNEEIAVEHACKVGLLCKETAFVAVDEAERIIGTNLTEHVYQPNIATQDMDCKILYSMSKPIPAVNFQRLNMDTTESFTKVIRSNETSRTSKIMRFFAKAISAPSLELESSASGKSLIRARDNKWRDQLLKLLGGYKAHLASLIEWLDQWMESAPDRSVIRFEALQNLVGDVKKARANERASIIEAFLDSNDFASSPFHEGACKAYNEWRQTLPTT
jgi:Ca-activated chloride channel family protein